MRDGALPSPANQLRVVFRYFDAGAATQLSGQLAGAGREPDVSSFALHGDDAADPVLGRLECVDYMTS